MSLKQREILGLMSAITGLLILLCLISYNPAEEPTISNNVAIDNWMGILGIYISHFLIKHFMGISAYLIPVLMMVWGYWIFFKKDPRRLTAITLAIIFTGFLMSILISLPTVIDPEPFSHDFTWSGLAAGVMTKALYDFIGLPGTILIIIGLLLIIVRLYFSVSYIKLIRKGLKKRPADKPEQSIEEFVEDIPDGKPLQEPAFERLQNETDEPEITKPENPKKKKKRPVKKMQKRQGNYARPSTKFLTEPQSNGPTVSKAELSKKSLILERELDTFKVQGDVVDVAPGPLITTFKVEPAAGIRVGRISRLADDLARVLEAIRIRIVAPIPGTSVVGIEIPNDKMETIYIKGVLESQRFKKSQSVVTLALGKTSTGEVYTADLRKMPHLLVAGATGSGKSVAVNMMIASILYKAKPDEVKFVLIDPKKLELAAYKKLIGYHLITCENLDDYVVTEPEDAVIILKSVVIEMEQRYDMLAGASVRNIEEYNEKIEQGKIQDEKLPYIVVVIDELADLMMTSAKEVEDPSPAWRKKPVLSVYI